MCDYDWDAPEAYEEKVVKTRVPHRCRQCCRLIPAGVSMTVCSGVWPDGPARWYLCEVCAWMLEQPEGHPFHACLDGLDDGYGIPEWIEAVYAFRDGRTPQGPLLPERQYHYDWRAPEPPEMRYWNDRLDAEYQAARKLGCLVL